MVAYCRYIKILVFHVSLRNSLRKALTFLNVTHGTYNQL